MSVKSTVCQTITRYLDRDKTMIFLFGSRASGHPRSTSDYDVGLFTGRKVRADVMAMIKSDLEESSLPVRVDVVDFSAVSKIFKNVSLQRIRIWNKPRRNLKLN